MEFLLNNLPIFIPLLVAQAALSLVALVHVLKHPHYRFGSKAMWVFLVLLVNTIGPIVYFVFGRGEEG